MANRDMNFDREVTKVVAEKPDDMWSAIAGFASKVADASAQAKLLEASSQAQIGFKKLDQDFRIKYEGDPNNQIGLKELSEARQVLINQLGESIPTLYTRDWSVGAKKLASASDTSNKLWAVEQNYKNVKTGVGNSIKNYLELAGAQGQEFGRNNSNDASVLLNYTTAYNSIKQFAEQNLGNETAGNMLKEFGPDYMKMVISGVAMTNPMKAQKLMEEKTVKDTLGADPEQYLKFKSAIDSRAKHYEKSIQQQGVISGVRADSAPLAKGGKMSYAEYATANLSDEAKQYYGTLNGFIGHGKRGGMTPEDKAGYRVAVIDSVTKLSKDENMDAGSVRVVQDAVFRAMNKGAITQSEGMGYIKQIVDPLLSKKEKSLDNFGVNNWFSDDIGFDGIKDYFDANIKRSTSGLTKNAARDIEVQNTIDKANLYDYYSASLGAQASQLGITVADISDLPSAKKKKIYATAQTEAQKLFMQDKHPALRTMPDVPNYVYNAKGELVQGMAGPRDLKPVAAAKSEFKTYRHKKTGELYRVYPDGKIEKAP